MPRPTSDVQAFEAHATDADLDDLRARLAAARLPEAETVYRAAPDPRRWEQGVPLAGPHRCRERLATGYNGGRSKSASTGSASSARPLTIWESTSCTADPRAQMPLL